METGPPANFLEPPAEMMLPPWTLIFYLPWRVYALTSSSNSFTHVEGVKSQSQTIGSIGRPDCGLEIIYRSILPKLDELHLLCAGSSPHFVCIVETWLDFSNELTVSN